MTIATFSQNSIRKEFFLAEFRKRNLINDEKKLQSISYSFALALHKYHRDQVVLATHQMLGELNFDDANFNKKGFSLEIEKWLKKRIAENEQKKPKKKKNKIGCESIEILLNWRKKNEHRNGILVYSSNIR